MKILMIGDVVGSPGRKIFKREIPRLKNQRGIDAVIVNAENVKPPATAQPAAIHTTNIYISFRHSIL
jgi:calcineurin-like phosphoesterase